MSPFMNINEAYTYVQSRNPPVIHVTGKTSTGKSTFSAELSRQLGYKIIELDQIVKDHVIKRFNLSNEGETFVEVYKHRSQRDWIASFIRSATEIIREHLYQEDRVIIEGAIANPDTLHELLAGLPDSAIFYLHPENLDNYIRNITSRFALSSKTDNAGLPAKFWSLVDAREFDIFCNTGTITPSILSTIEAYAVGSKMESNQRLQALQRSFANTMIVTI